MTNIGKNHQQPHISLLGAAEDFESENSNCECIYTDIESFEQKMKEANGTPGFEPNDKHQHLISRTPVFVPEETVGTISSIINAINTVAETQAYQEHVFQSLPEIARFNSGLKSVFMGYDFHLTKDGPQLIEINTNAGGAMINSRLLSSQTTCCSLVSEKIAGDMDLSKLHDSIYESFMAEWQALRYYERPTFIAIVEDQPTDQYLYPALLLFTSLFEERGIDCEIVSPAELHWNGYELTHRNRHVDLVYNRLTDFYLETPEAAALRSAYLEGAIALTPNPHMHALLANKKNLTFLSSSDQLTSWGIDPETVQLLDRHIPFTELVTEENAESLWARRKQLFFKPAAGFGSRGAYKGGKLTKRVWEELLSGDYIAQEFVAPSMSAVNVNGETTQMKVDLRAYVYDRKIQLIAARRYQGQTTNMRTPGGGFASVFSAAG